VTTVLLDFFGTLVDYSPGLTDRTFHRSFAVFERLGFRLGHEAWLAGWSGALDRLYDTSVVSGVEFSMHEAFDAFAADAGLGDCDPTAVDAFVATFGDEWSDPVRLIDGVPDLLAGLRARGCAIGLVSNTHSASMVRGHLDAMGVAAAFDVVVTSVEVGFRKPRPEIYRVALDALDAAPGDTVFVGDTYDADFVGPTLLGINAYLVVGDGQVTPDDVPADRRLRSVLELARLDL